ncbi:MAG TPA: hypothetical protein VGI20_09330 [Rhizomicrobium sp.]|jgi:hypothetical protein
MHGLFVTAGLVLAAIIAYGFRRPILSALARFDERNAERKLEEARDRRDRLAHYKHTMLLAEEQVDRIVEKVVADERTGAPVTRFLFAGETFASREDAEAARIDAIAAKAREFYVELPAALSRRGDGTLR